MVCVRHGGTVQRRIRQDAASAVAEGREEIPNSHSSFRPIPAEQAAHPGNSDYFRVIPSNSDFTKKTRRGRPFTKLHFPQRGQSSSKIFYHGFREFHGFRILHFAFCILHFLIRAIRAIRGSSFLVAVLRRWELCASLRQIIPNACP